MPITTARRKGLFVPNKNSDTSVDDSGHDITPRRTLSFKVTDAVNLDDDDVVHGYGSNRNGSQGDVSDEEDSTEDDSFDPISALDDSDDSDEIVVSEHDDDDEYGPLTVHDNFDPYEGPH